MAQGWSATPSNVPPRPGRDKALKATRLPGALSQQGRAPPGQEGTEKKEGVGARKIQPGEAKGIFRVKARGDLRGEGSSPDVDPGGRATTGKGWRLLDRPLQKYLCA